METRRLAERLSRFLLTPELQNLARDHHAEATYELGDKGIRHRAKDSV